MKQLNEVARMQQLAGINEIKILKPNEKIIKYQDENYYFKLNNDVLEGFLDDEDNNTPTFTFHDLTDEQREKFLNLFNDDEIVDYDEEDNWFMIIKDAFKII